MTEYEFLAIVRAYSEAHPEVAPKIGEATREGIMKALRAANKRAANFEVVAAIALSKRYRNADKILAREKIAEMEGKTSLRWDWLLETED